MISAIRTPPGPRECPTPRTTTSSQRILRRWCWVLGLAWAGTLAALAAEGDGESDESTPPATPPNTEVSAPQTEATGVRPYIHLRSGEFNTVWGVQDMWAAGIGADFTRYLSVELALDSYEKDFDPWGQKLGEQSLISLVPQVRLRLPLAKDRIVPYVLAGAGIGWYDYNDPLGDGFNYEIDAQGQTLVISGGLGVDLALNEHLYFNLEGKYIWLDELKVSRTPVGGGATETATYNMADFVVTMGLRAYLDNPGRLPLLDAVEKPPVRIYMIAGFGGGVIVDGDWVPGVSLKQEAASIGEVGQSIELGFGVNFGRHFSVEIPVDYYEGTVHLDNVGGVSGNVGEYSTYAAIPVARYRHPLRSGKWVPFIMAGVGLAYSEFNDGSPEAGSVGLSAKGTTLGIAAGGGIEYHFNPDINLFGQIKYVHSFDNKISTDVFGEQSGDLSWLHFQIGLRMNLLKLGGR